MNKIKPQLILAFFILFSLACICGIVSSPQKIIIVQATAIPTQTMVPTQTAIPTIINMQTLAVNTIVFECNGISYTVTAKGKISPDCYVSYPFQPQPRFLIEDGTLVNWDLVRAGLQFNDLSVDGPYVHFPNMILQLKYPEFNCFSKNILISGVSMQRVRLPADVHCSYDDMVIDFYVPDQ